MTLQAFYGILTQHFANLASEVPLPIALIDALTVQILELTPEVPLYAATVALARLKRMQEALSHSLKDLGTTPSKDSLSSLILKSAPLAAVFCDKRMLHPNSGIQVMRYQNPRLFVEVLLFQVVEMLGMEATLT